MSKSSTPARKSSGPSVANGKTKSQRHRESGSGASELTISSPPRADSLAASLGLVAEAGDSSDAMSMWDGDDMTLEMVTDAGDGDVDEDVRARLGFGSIPQDADRLTFVETHCIVPSRAADTARYPPTQTSSLQTSPGTFPSLPSHAASCSPRRGLGPARTRTREGNEWWNGYGNAG